MKNPVGTSRAAALRYPGANPTSVSATANSSAAVSTRYIDGRDRRPVPASAPQSAPAASEVDSSPNERAPAWNAVLASTARVTWKLNPIMPTTSMSAMVATRSGRPRTYRRPALMRASLAGTRNTAARYSSPGRIRSADTSGPTQSTALATNTGPRPNHAIDTPDTAGPTIRAVLNVAADSPSAFGSSSRPTSSETNACRTGVSIALITPVTAASANTCHSRAQPPATRTPITSAATANPALTAMSNSRLSNRSASF